jgi:hypothetical protein
MAVRDLGKAVVAFTKPDGTPALLDPVTTAVPNGLAKIITNLSEARAADPIKDGKSKVLPNPNSPISSVLNLQNVVYNPLENFASYSPLWTLAVLTPKQFNNPDLYRKNPDDLENVVFSSGGRFDNVKVDNANARIVSQRVQTASGTPEYFVNNFVMKATVAANERTGNSNAVNFEFDIYEPYSMGLLLQSLQVAAKQAGYLNYLDNAPYVLRLDFEGWTESGLKLSSVLPKFFVLKLTSVKFTVNEQGSSYKVIGVPYNHAGFADTVNAIFNDVKITVGPKGTVEEALQSGAESLASVLNGIEATLVKDNKIGIPDVYDIQFPNSSAEFTRATKLTKTNSATQDPNNKDKNVIPGTKVQFVSDFDANVIGGSKFGFTAADGGNFPFKKRDDSVNDKGLVIRDNMTIDPTKRTFQFAQGQTVTSIINQIILSSEYAKAAVIKQNAVDNLGFIKWWKIDVQVEMLEYDDKTGDFAKKITYRVLPFQIHHTVFSSVSTAPIGYPELQKKIVKAYNYIYTGANVDVLKFDIQIDNLFYSGINSSAENKSAKGADPNTSGGTGKKPAETTETPSGPDAKKVAVASGGRARNTRSPDLLKKAVGGTGATDVAKEVAENFHQSFLSGSSADMIKVNLEILGDPYWMVDSGFANYFAKPDPANDQQTEDGTMNYESGDVFVYLTFRTPVDINESTGLYQWPLAGKESPFTGIYRVIMCESSFQDGNFKQKLECLRMPGQEKDFKDAPAEDKKQTPYKESVLATILKKPVSEKSTPQEKS